VAPAAVVEALDVFEDRVCELDVGSQCCRLSSSVCMRPQNDCAAGQFTIGAARSAGTH
jgi:hypothetical protein